MNFYNNDYTILTNLSLYLIVYSYYAFEPFNGKLLLLNFTLEHMIINYAITSMSLLLGLFIMV